MVLKMEQYTELRETFVQIAKYHSDNVALGRLKDNFAPIINSKRALDQIKTIEDLIRILEKRGFLRYDKIDALKDISRELVHDAKIDKQLNDYEIWLRGYVWPHPPHTNLYKLYNAVPSAPSHERPSSSFEGRRQQSVTEPCLVQQPAYTPSHPVGFFPNATSQPPYGNEVSAWNTPAAPTKKSILQQKVFLSVSERLGRKWKDTARHLGLRESDIDEIESRTNLAFKDKAYEALQRFASTNDPHYWERDLKRALDAAKRRDLRELVEELMLRRD